ncbi:MAG TPA: hypothetical protein VFU21_04870 [Kofleriaceae bacterium]|nr:hypothetical protein [Kofleriaceae bacterium]
MRITLITCLAFAMTLAACGKGEGGDKQPPAATKTGAAPAAVDYGAIDKMVDAARTGDDFTNVLMACGKLELDAAAGGNGELAKDDTYREHCRRRPTHLRAEMAIKESTPDKMSAHCLSATMGLEELVKDGIKAPESTELLGKVKAACGM